MSARNEEYKCGVCGNIVELLHVGGGELVCCGQPMQKLEVKTSEAEGKEKHVPVVEKTDKGVKVKVGSVQHPMEDKHYIEWIEIIADGKELRKYLKPGNVPEAEFCTEASDIIVREYCSVHGLWSN